MMAHTASLAFTAKYCRASAPTTSKIRTFGQVSNGALHGLVEALDPNSSYLSPDEYKLYKKLGTPAAGIGAVVSKRFGYGNVVSVVPGGPADKAGLVPETSSKP